jgi:PIN domain nuclease of toxin-antitoxin system
MKLILDTHAFLWFFNGDEQLSPQARLAIEDDSNEKYVSLASLWELAIKISIGKWSYESGLNGIIALVNQNGFLWMPVRQEHILRLTTLPLYHKDPFDRLLITQALSESCLIVSKDEVIHQYPVKYLW